MDTTSHWEPSRPSPLPPPESPTQTKEDAALQADSGELWGKAGRMGGLPAARAYVGPLPDGARGVEFTCAVSPEPNQAPYEARWYAGSPGVETRYMSDMQIAVVPITVVRNTQC